MGYRVILTKNGVYKKTLHRSQRRDTSFINFNRIQEENNVFFERQYINYKGIIPVEYDIRVIKDYEEGDKRRFVRNKLGQVVEEDLMGDIWVVLADAPYKFEETFWVYGNDPIHDRKDIVGLIQMLMDGMGNARKTKQIVIIKNKLLFYDEDNFDMVICKCMKDAQRLHHTLFKAATDNNIKNLYFMGTVTDKKILGDYYELIHSHTNWDYTKIWRTTTRP